MSIPQQCSQTRLKVLSYITGKFAVNLQRFGGGLSLTHSLVLFWDMKYHSSNSTISSAADTLFAWKCNFHSLIGDLVYLMYASLYSSQERSYDEVNYSLEVDSTFPIFSHHYIWKKHFSEEGQGYQVPCENFLVAFKWIPAISVLTGGGGWRTKCIYYEEEHHFLGWGHSRSSARPRVRKSKTLHHPWICFLELFPPSCQKKRWRNKDVYVNLFTKHGEEMCAMQENNSSFQKR